MSRPLPPRATPSSADAILRARDKLRCHQTLAAVGIDATIVSNDTPAHLRAVYTDRAFDIRLRLVEEGDWTPAVAIGLRDLVGINPVPKCCGKGRRVAARHADVFEQDRERGGLRRPGGFIGIREGVEVEAGRQFPQCQDDLTALDRQDEGLLPARVTAAGRQAAGSDEIGGAGERGRLGRACSPESGGAASAEFLQVGLPGDGFGGHQGGDRQSGDDQQDRE
jgi:hypothetical protein